VREGFEPSVGFKAYGALAKLCFRPLSHLTKLKGKVAIPDGRRQCKSGRPRSSSAQKGNPLVNFSRVVEAFACHDGRVCPSDHWHFFCRPEESAAAAVPARQAAADSCRADLDRGGHAGRFG